MEIEKQQNKYIIKKQKDMNTDAVLYLNEELFKQVEEDAINQIVNVASLPEIVGNAIAMPDMHSGYGFPIGGVAAFDYENGIVSPGGIGFDINCGVRLLKTNISLLEEKNILDEMYNAVPSGVGSETDNKLDKSEFLELVVKGIDWAISNGYATKKDKESIEDYGRLDAEIDFLSQRAIARGRKQIGTLGSGNHFVELQIIEEVYDKELAEKWGLKAGDLTVMVHTGSRGFGHQVASDFVKEFLTKQNISLKDNQLIYAKIHSQLGQQYLKSMHAAANFAYVNRQLITHNLRNVFKNYGINLDLLYDVAHNIAKKETYIINGEKRDVLVHRKGATRAFSKQNKQLPEKYFETGQPVLLPGSMGSFSYVLVGDNAEKETFGSVAHGAGRVMSRSKALKTLDLEKLEKQLKNKNIEVKSPTRKGIVEEAPEVYKDVSLVVDVLIKNKLAKPVVKLKPLKVIKG